jgi:dienelactone hydrolase
VKLAIEFMRRGAAQFKISTGRIVGLGFSDGARYIGETLPWDNDDVSFQTDPQVDDHLDAAILLYGDYSLDPIAPPARSCIRNVVQISTPVLLMHGTGDTDTPWTQSQEFYDSLLVHQKACQLRLFSGGQHGFELNWPSTTAFTVSGLIAKDTALSFLHRVLNPATAVSESPAPRVVSFFLEQNYPNPFNPTTKINFQIPHSSFVILKVFDILGKEVATLVNEELHPGNHETTFDGNGFASGVYFYRIQAGDFVQTRKLVLLR